VDVCEVSIFEGPTVAALTRLLDPEQEEGEGESQEASGRSRGERRRAVRKSRRAIVEVA